MSSSSSLCDPPPPDAALEEALRSVVQNIYKTGKLDDLTVKRVRSAAEKELDLRKDFFKDHPSWKDRSKHVIQSEVEAHPEPASSQASPPKKLPLKKPPPASAGAPKPPSQANGQKRSATGEAGPRKRRKTDDLGVDISSSEGQKRQQKRSGAKPKRPKSPSSPPTQDFADGIGQGEPVDKEVSTVNGDGAMDSESEMSVVLDEDTKPKAKRQSGGSEKPKPKKSSGSKASKPDFPADPDTEEIKRLQGWLVKCGIRKMWHKELQPYDTTKAKIRHLKYMLSDAGMTGRYSTEKASQIREERELKADLEAVQAGNKQWGKAGSEDEGIGRPKRRLARGLESLDFLNDDDGEETD